METVDLVAQRLLSTIENVDIIVGIPSYNSAKTIGHVINQSARGLENFSNLKSLILVSDGGSSDATVQIAKEAQLPKDVKLVACRYQGVSGKGTAVRAILEAATYLDVRSLAMVDSDLESITPSWIKLLIEPTLNQVGLVTPRYQRHKYDGTITNQLCYPLTRALYGKRVRQPIGGDFGLSAKLAKCLLESPLWKCPYVPRFGIDIFITTSAIAEGFSVEEADLGVKIHGAKDPALHLASMFREVASSALICMERYEEVWRKIKGSVPVRLGKNQVENIQPPSITPSLDRLIEQFKGTYSQSDAFRSMLSSKLSRELDFLASILPEKTVIPLEVWTRTVFEVSAKFKRSDYATRNVLLDGLRSVWSGRVASFVKETASMSNEEAERKVEEDAAHFEQLKSELLRVY
jgi:glycosyltransferase involved in cell wall biosynthesis